MGSLKITRGTGFHLTFENGVVLAVQIGGGNYCDNYDAPIERNPSDLPASTTAEFAVWNTQGSEMLELAHGDTIAAYVPMAKVVKVIAKLSALTAPTPKSIKSAVRRAMK
jgi:hypothetical protein